MFFVDELKDFKMYKKKFLYPINNANKNLSSAVILLSPNMNSSIGIINHELCNNKFIKSGVNNYMKKVLLVFLLFFNVILVSYAKFKPNVLL